MISNGEYGIPWGDIFKGVKGCDKWSTMAMALRKLMTVNSDMLRDANLDRMLMLWLIDIGHKCKCKSVAVDVALAKRTRYTL